MDDDNMFDKDEALDYIIYNDMKDAENKKRSNGGCMPIILFSVTGSLSVILHTLIKI